MTIQPRIRQFDFDGDYESVIRLWQTIKTGMHIGPSDAPGEIKKKVERDPDLFLVAELNGEIIASIIGGFDGRRGMIYHLAVRSDFRRQGIGQLLLQEVEGRLKDKGCIKCLLMVLEDNETAKRFYEECGWTPVPEDLVFMKMFI